MDVVIYSAGMPFNGTTVLERSLGGSETAAYALAKELAKRGHRVKCFTSLNDPPEAVVDGVTYVWHGQPSQNAPLGDRFEHYATNTPHDVLLIQRHPLAFHKRYAAKVCIWQLHDFANYRTAGVTLGGTWQIDAITCVSEWHREQIGKVWGFNPDTVHVIPNGVDPELYRAGLARINFTLNKNEDGPFERTEEHSATVPSKKFLLLYQSRPERGLDNALQLMEQAKLTGLPVHLLVCGYDNTTDHMRGYYESLWAKCREAGNVTLLGSLSKAQLADVQRQCDLLLYPTAFDEVSCITAMEAMHAGLPMLTSAVAALPETCTDSGTVLIPMTNDGKADLDAFDSWMQTTFGLVLHGQYPEALTELRLKQFAAARSRTWETVTDQFEALVAKLFKAKQNVPAILRDAIEHSDIGLARHVIANASGKDLFHPIADKATAEINRLYQFTASQDAYKAHYAHHQGEYYDQHEASVIGEDVTATARFRGTFDQVCEHIRRTKALTLRILDYGCAHGHYSMPMAQRLGQCEFVGIDISERAVAAARKWAERDGVDNVTFLNGDQSTLDDEALGTFDVIVAGEVVEHVWDYCALLNKLKARLRPGGVLIVTTPAGRWEHSGTVAFRTGREHLHHFEREDIEDICRGHDVRVLHAPAGHDRAGEPLGSWVWAVWPSPSIPLWKVDYERKLSQYAPRQTISACMIVKDGEKTLRRCVESFVDWVDEVIILIDPATKDRTLQIASQLSIDFPNRTFVYGVGENSALRDGFAAARNESIAKASGDWILWIDADEELRNAWNLHKVCRPSMHKAYGFAQVHYAVDPEQVLTTDFPCRLFRNGIGVQFYGLVHEHPEVELGKAIPYSLVRPEMKFLHHGYFDEETRRARYVRNLPLLKRDRAQYPTERPLNQFLWLRDLAQGIQFDAERMGPRPEHLAQAAEGIKIMEQIADMPQLKMITDAMPYYSLCVATTGGGFDADISFQTRHSAAPDLAVNSSIKGRFHSRDFYLKLVNKFSQESTKHYEDRYL